MEQHYQIVADIRNVYRIMRDQMMQADSEWAAAFNSLSETLPERLPVAPTPGPYILPGGSTR
jgi:nitrate reductase assembly molybdenum cofactor insertion protein NarJ